MGKAIVKTKSKYPGGKHPGGRPPKYKTAEALQKKIDQYFLHGYDYRKVVNKDGIVIDVPVITITGLVIFCGFCDRAAFYDYEVKPEFRYTIKMARTRIELEYEKLLQSGLGAGAIFALKNFGWKDKTEVEHSGKVVTMAMVTDGRGKPIRYDIGSSVDNKK